MTFSVSVLYPKTATSTFDMDYYLKKHMPLVAERWSSQGLKKWEVVQFGPNPQGEQPYSVQAILTWDKQESLGAASEKNGAEIFGDIPNFSSEQPTLVTGHVVASG